MTITKSHPSLRALLSPIINHGTEVQIEKDRSYSTPLPNPISNCKTVRISSLNTIMANDTPNLFNTCHKASRGTESKAFLRSTKRIKRRLLCSLAFSIVGEPQKSSEQPQPRQNPQQYRFCNTLQSFLNNPSK